MADGNSLRREVLEEFAEAAQAPAVARHVRGCGLAPTVAVPTAGAKLWWRVAIDANERISARQVERSREATAVVFYVEAHDQPEAERIGWRRYCRMKQRAYREQLKARGLCMWCGKTNNREAHQRCTPCVVKARGYSARSAARRGGHVLPDARRSDHPQRKRWLTELRLDTLLEIQQAFTCAADSEAFTRWLKGEIEKLASRRVA
ncbi:MAG TPA: hypothetical protein VGP93_17240 [Polyangiaceae bacterium]|jgi:hypothetical protein|nr:hypothetical protein [Polyangiaceae bacterium]